MLRKRKSNNNTKTNDSLVKFLTEHQTPTTLKVKPGSSRLLQTLPNASNDYSYVLFFAVSNENQSIIIPVIIMIKNENVPRNEEMNDLWRFRINHTPYTGKIMIVSNDRVEVEKGIESAAHSIKLKPGYFLLRTEFVTYATTQPSDIIKADPKETRSLFLKSMLGLDTVSVEDDFNFSSMHDYDHFNNDTNHIHGHESPQIDEILHQVEINATTGSKTDQIFEKDSEHEVSDIFKKKVEVEYLSSDEEPQNSSKNTVKRRKLHNFSCDKLTAKILDDRNRAQEKADSDIIVAFEKLKEALPTLPNNAQSTPILKNMFILMEAFNMKLAHLQDKRALEAAFAMERKINITKVKGKDEMRIGDRFTFGVKEYNKAKEAAKPCLVISRLMRSWTLLSDIQWKVYLNEKTDLSNFLFIIGKDNLEDEERLADGKEALDMLIEHAHAIKGMKEIKLSSYKNCMGQVTKALYDFNRRVIGDGQNETRQNKQSNKTQITMDSSSEKERGNRTVYNFN